MSNDNLRQFTKEKVQKQAYNLYVANGITATQRKVEEYFAQDLTLGL